MASILDLLGLGSAAPAGASAPPPTHAWGYDPQGYLTPQLNGGGQPQAPQPPQGQPGSFVQNVAQQAPAGPLVSAATNPPPSGSAPPQAPSGQPDNAPISIQGDNWKPKHDGILGQIADYFLGTHFSDHVMHQNQEAALSQLSSDPMAAVKRMAQFDPQGATALYSQVMREQHQAALEKHSGDVYENTAENQQMGVARNMAMNVTPENMAATRAQTIKYLQAKNAPQALIDTVPGDNATVDDWKTFAQGGVPAGRQASITSREGIAGQQSADRAASLAERRDFHGNLIPILRQNAGTSAGRLDETISNDTANQAMRQEGLDDKPPGRSFVDTKYGRGETSKDGMVMRISPNDPRIDQSKLHMETDPKTGKPTGKGYLIYDNTGTARAPRWRLRH